jgi:hypothetical protein
MSQVISRLLYRSLYAFLTKRFSLSVTFCSITHLTPEPKDLDSLNTALRTLGLTVDPYLQKIQPAPPASTPLSPTALPVSTISVGILPSAPNTYQSFYMNATYQDTKIPQIRCALTALKEQLIDSEVIFDTADGRLTVSGVFTDEARDSIEATIRHLERLFTSCQLTGDIQCVTTQEPLLALTNVCD